MSANTEEIIRIKPAQGKLADLKKRMDRGLNWRRRFGLWQRGLRDGGWWFFDFQFREIKEKETFISQWMEEEVADIANDIDSRSTCKPGIDTELIKIQDSIDKALNELKNLKSEYDAGSRDEEENFCLNRIAHLDEEQNVLLDYLRKMPKDEKRGEWSRNYEYSVHEWYNLKSQIIKEIEDKLITISDKLADIEKDVNKKQRIIEEFYADYNHYFMQLKNELHRYFMTASRRKKAREIRGKFPFSDLDSMLEIHSEKIQKPKFTIRRVSGAEAKIETVEISGCDHKEVADHKSWIRTEQNKLKKGRDDAKKDRDNRFKELRERV